jgi:hypothetical protein
VLSLKMNDAAVELLGPLIGMEPPGGLTPGLRKRAACGIVRRGKVLTWADSTSRAEDAPSVFRDLTAWECADSSFHLEDLVAEPDQRTLLLHGVAFAREFSRSALALDPPSKVRCILSADETHVTFRFHQIRQGEDPYQPDLDRYSPEKVVVLDIETGWSHLRDARGSAVDVPELLGRLRPERSAAWDEAWARLCPHGSVFPAGFAALPHLMRLAASWTPAARVEPLLLAGAILGSREGHSHVAGVRGRYEVEIFALRRLTQESLRSSFLLENTDTYVRLLRALAAFEGLDPCDAHLAGLIARKHEISCPHCAAGLSISLGDDGYVAAHGTVTTDLLPADPRDLEGTALVLHRTATRDQQKTVALQLTYLFGQATCPSCGALIPMASLTERVTG